MFFAKYLKQFGHNPIILTVDPKYASYNLIDNSLIDQVKDIEVHKTASFEILKLYSIFKSGTKTRAIPQSYIPTNSFFDKIASFIRLNFFIPDSRIGWNYFAFKKAKKLIKDNNINCVITSGPPHSSHLIGKKIYNKFKLKWIVDLRDPWAELFYLKNKFQFNYVKKLNLNHVVITSVDRDDLDDGGSNHFYEVINQTRKINPNTTIEVLTPDFLRKGDAYKKVLDANPDVFNHNIETVPSLYLKVRPGSRYFASLELLKNAKKMNSRVFTKSGIMVGLGETRDEILQVMDDLKSADVDFLTIGQYLQPSVKHFPLDRYYKPEEFKELGDIAKAKGFLLVSSSPLTRSSYHADEDFAKLQQNRLKNH